MSRSNSRFLRVATCPSCLEKRKVRVSIVGNYIEVHCNKGWDGCGSKTLVPREPIFENEYRVSRVGKAVGNRNACHTESVPIKSRFL